MHRQMSSQSLMLVKGLLLYVLLISFAGRQLNSEARPNSDQKDRLNREQLEEKVEQLQNASTCIYTVEPVKEPHAGWQLKELYHIKCVNVNNHCSANDGHRHVCMQTYKWVKVNKNTEEKMKIYTGCVCAYKHHHNFISITKTDD